MINSFISIKLCCLWLCCLWLLFMRFNLHQSLSECASFFCTLSINPSHPCTQLITYNSNQAIKSTQFTLSMYAFTQPTTSIHPSFFSTHRFVHFLLSINTPTHSPIYPSPHLSDKSSTHLSLHPLIPHNHLPTTSHLPRLLYQCCSGSKDPSNQLLPILYMMFQGTLHDVYVPWKFAWCIICSRELYMMYNMLFQGTLHDV